MVDLKFQGAFSVPFLTESKNSRNKHAKMRSTIPISSNKTFACFNDKVMTQSMKNNTFAIMPITTTP